MYACHIDLQILAEEMECATSNVVDWFKYNYMKFNPVNEVVIRGGSSIKIDSG